MVGSGCHLEVSTSSSIVSLSNRVGEDTSEDFLLACAHELGVDMAEYGLPNTLAGLKGVTKSNESDKEPRVKKLVNALRGASEMARLERTVSYLHSKQYGTTVEELVKVFG